MVDSVLLSSVCGGEARAEGEAVHVYEVCAVAVFA
jgi:hypothetical protein